MLSNINLHPYIEVHASPRTSHFRLKCRFGITRDSSALGRLDYAMFERGRLEVVRSFPAASEAICDILEPLLRQLEERSALSDGLSAVSFLASRKGSVLVTLMNSSPLPDAWEAAAEAVVRELGLAGLVGRSKGEVRTAPGGNDFVWEEMSLDDGRRLRYKQVDYKEV